MSGSISTSRMGLFNNKLRKNKVSLINYLRRKLRLYRKKARNNLMEIRSQRRSQKKYCIGPVHKHRTLLREKLTKNLMPRSKSPNLF
jgi:hypothetical protein